MDKEEFMDLLQVKYAVSDYLLALDNAEFADMWGGVDALLNELKCRYEEYELKWNEDAE